MELRFLSHSNDHFWAHDHSVKMFFAFKKFDSLMFISFRFDNGIAFHCLILMKVFFLCFEWIQKFLGPTSFLRWLWSRLSSLLPTTTTFASSWRRMELLSLSKRIWTKGVLAHSKIVDFSQNEKTKSIPAKLSFFPFHWKSDCYESYYFLDFFMISHFIFLIFFNCLERSFFFTFTFGGI